MATRWSDPIIGPIRIGNDYVVRSVISVNGSIKIGQDVSFGRWIEAVNGVISMDHGSHG